jgi:hypothetical protein
LTEGGHFPEENQHEEPVSRSGVSVCWRHLCCDLDFKGLFSRFFSHAPCSDCPETAAARWCSLCLVRQQMPVRKAVALWVLLLALSPFTAPFATCDLSALSSATARQNACTGKVSPGAAMLVDVVVAQGQSPESPASGRAKFVVNSPSFGLTRASAGIGTGAERSWSFRPDCRSGCSPRLRI